MTSGAVEDRIDVLLLMLVRPVLLGGPVTQVRQTFVDYFADKQKHTFFPSSPVVPVNDPSLLFANAGMNQVCEGHTDILGTGPTPYLGSRHPLR